jgi:hypothetical protein
MQAHTKLHVLTARGELEEELLPPRSVVSHLPHHLMQVTTLDGACITWNFRHVVKYQLTEMPASPAEGS